MFEQTKIRSHLHLCLTEGSFKDFPTRRIGRKITKVLATFIYSIYCLCRMPEIREMIKCDAYKKWYHIDLCVNVPDVVRDNKAARWYCNSCNP